MTTKRTVADAKEFIETTIVTWLANQEENKVISLAQFAERWSNTGGGPKSKIKSIRKDIKAYDLMIKRAQDRGDEISVLEGMKLDLEEELDKLTAEVEGVKSDVDTDTIKGIFKGKKEK